MNNLGNLLSAVSLLLNIQLERLKMTGRNKANAVEIAQLQASLLELGCGVKINYTRKHFL